MKSALNIGCIDAVQQVLTVAHVNSIRDAVNTFRYASGKTKRRFARKAAARITTLTDARQTVSK